MTHFICSQCGVQFAASAAAPEHCPICQDERQFVRWEGQAWTDMNALGRDHRLQWRDEDGVTGIGIEPSFAIGQRALLIEEPDGCVLWDCTSLVTPDIVEAIGRRGGLKAIAISHPHFYSAMVEWSEAFGGVPIYLHADDRQWVMRQSPSIMFWEGETHRLSDALTLIRCGGHFDGGTMLHWADGAAGRRRAVRRRHRHGDDGPGACELHVQLSQQHSARRGGSPAHRGGGCAFRRSTASMAAGGTATSVAAARQAFDRSVARYLAAIS